MSLTDYEKDLGEIRFFAEGFNSLAFLSSMLFIFHSIQGFLFIEFQIINLWGKRASRRSACSEPGEPTLGIPSDDPTALGILGSGLSRVPATQNL